VSKFVINYGIQLFNSLSQDQTSQRSQIAKYAIAQAASYMADGRTDAAIKSFQKALAFDDKNQTALKYLGNLYLSKNDNQSAIKAFKRLADVDPQSADYQVTLGNAYLQDKQYAKSEQAFQKAAKLDPKNPLPEYTLGLQYLDNGDLKKAEAQFLKVQRMAPSDGNVYYALGRVYNAQGNYESAARNLNMALGLKSDFPAANYELGVAYSNLGFSDAAKDQLKILKNTGSSYYTDLASVLNKPTITSMDTSSGKLNVALGAKTPVLALDPVHLNSPNSSAMFSVNITFSNDMDITSVTNLNNWSISRAKSTIGGYYNNNLYASATGQDAKISQPLSISYNAVTRTATVSFLVGQNSAGTATIDPKHLVFSFSGKDAAGRTMDASGDEIDGFAGRSF
jgi:tetratricopeptide (TPR) repeat protein